MSTLFYDTIKGMVGKTIASVEQADPNKHSKEYTDMLVFTFTDGSTAMISCTELASLYKEGE